MTHLFFRSQEDQHRQRQTQHVLCFVCVCVCFYSLCDLCVVFVVCVVLWFRHFLHVCCFFFVCDLFFRARVTHLFLGCKKTHTQKAKHNRLVSRFVLIVFFYVSMCMFLFNYFCWFVSCDLVWHIWFPIAQYKQTTNTHCFVLWFASRCLFGAFVVYCFVLFGWLRFNRFMFVFAVFVVVVALCC